MKRLMLLFVLGHLVGCAQTPVDYPWLSYEPVTRNNAALFDRSYDEITEQLEVLKVVGADVCLPGKVAIIKQQLRSVQLERRAGLWPEATERLHISANLIQRLQCELQSVQNSTACSMTNDIKTPLTQWYIKARYDECNAPESSGVKAQPKIIADITLFATDSYELTEIAKASLNQWWLSIADIYQGPIQVTGHTDTRGSILHNQELSQNRAHAVANFLITIGVSPTRLNILALGESRPLVQEHDDLSLQMNRRVKVNALLQKESL